MKLRQWIKAIVFGLCSTLFLIIYMSLQLHSTKPGRSTNIQNYKMAKREIQTLEEELLKVAQLPNRTSNVENPKNSNHSGQMQENVESLRTKAPSVISEQSDNPDEIQLALACCLGGLKADSKQIALTKTFLKSLFTFNKNNIHLHVFVSKNFSRPVVTLVNSFKTNTTTFKADFYHSSMPKLDNIIIKDGPIGTRNVSLENLFKPCSAQRLFLPYNLNHLEKIIYIDTDTLVLGPISGLWRSFNQFNSSHLYGMSFIARHPGFYDKRPFPMPYKGLTGHNAGVMLMHLRRMREIGWNDIALNIISELSGPGWAFASDQDVLNYYNGMHPNDVFEMPCSFNWRWSYCSRYNGLPQECEDAHYNGITIIHGVSGTFFKQSNFVMRIYRIFAAYEFETSIEQFLIEPIKSALLKYKDYLCASNGDSLFKKMSLFVGNEKTKKLKE